MKKRYKNKNLKHIQPSILPTTNSVSNGINQFVLRQAFKNMTMDGFSNPLANMGDDTSSLLEGTQYNMSRLSFDWGLLNTLYRTHWIVRRIVDVPAEDMTKSWYKIKSELPPEAIRKIEVLERKTSLRSKILEGLRWSRLYGGSAGIIIIEGQEDVLSEPLDYDYIMPGSFKGLIILDRWTGIFPSGELVEDFNDRDYGLPDYYIIQDEAMGNGIRVHHSRIVRFINRDLPYYEKMVESYWGASEIEHVYDELKKRDNSSWNIASLIFSANLKIYQMEGFEQLAAMDDRAKQDLFQTLMLMNWMMNSNGMQIMGKEDSFDTKQYSFGGLSDVYELFMMDVSGAAEMPVTKLFGRSPAGMNATGESDMQNYYDSIEQKQEAILRPVFEKLLPIMCTSEFGAVPDDLDFEFNPVRRPSEEERKNLAQQTATAIVSVFNAGIISQKTALKELRQSAENTGMWTNISDEDIENADGDTGLLGEKIPTDIFNQPENSLENHLEGGAVG